MKITKKLLASTAISAFALVGFSSCGDGDAEDAGEKIDEAAEEVVDEVDDATD